jgi:glycosyltransferase 2 family protein
MSSRWVWARSLAGVAILAVLVWRVGTGPFLHAIPMIDARSLAAVVAVSGVTTVCCAWRWRLVAGGLGLGVPLPRAVAAYFRSQFLNTTLPGGVLGDVHRGWRHGRETGDLGRAARAVAWERVAGQLVQAVLAVLVLLALPSPVRPSLPLVLAGATLTLVVAAVLAGARARSGRTVWGRLARTAAEDLRHGLLSRQVWPGVVLASAVAVAGHVTVFLVAARVAGSNASTRELLPLAVLVLLAMSVPTNVAGWGPREGMAAWAFSAAGLGAAEGVATAVVYGVLSFAASLPGAVVLVIGWWHGRRPVTADTDPAAWRPTTEGAVRA